MQQTKRILFILITLTIGHIVHAATGDLPQIVVDPDTKKIYVTTGYFQNTGDTQIENNNTVDIQSGSNEGNGSPQTNDTQNNTNTTTNTSNDNQTTNTLTNNIDPELEFSQALERMYTNGLTKYNNETDYRPADYLTREEAAKIIGQAYDILGFTKETKNTDCTFDDADLFDLSLTDHIQNVCERGLFKGDSGSYFPRQTLTRPQAIAVLIRMFEGKVSYENQVPRRGDYYDKGKTIGIVTETDINAFDRSITRKEIALYINRLKDIITNDQLKTMSLNAISNIGQQQNSNNLNEETVNNNLSILAAGINTQDPELIEAISRMHDKGLTIYASIGDYRPFETLLREEAAKMLNKFANVFSLGTTKDNYLPNECTFSDINTADPSLQAHIEDICKLGLLKGNNKQFNPKQPISKAHMIVALIRLFEGKHLDETISPRWKNYYEKALELGIVGPSDVVTFDNAVTRYEVALYLYRFNVKYQLLGNLNNTRLQNEVVSTVPGSIDDNAQTANVYVDTNLLNDTSFEIGYIETFGNRYKLVRTATEKYFTDNYVRYGDLFNLETDEKVGTISFIVSNGFVVEGTVRFPSQPQTYVIKGVQGTNAYYSLAPQSE